MKPNKNHRLKFKQLYFWLLLCFLLNSNYSNLPTIVRLLFFSEVGGAQLVAGNDFLVLLGLEDDIFNWKWKKNFIDYQPPTVRYLKSEENRILEETKM